MNNFAFCTVAYGDKYLKWSKSLIEDITSKGVDIFVLTNNIDYYSSIDNTNLKIINYNKPYFSFNEKKTVVKECLRYFDTAVFLDADIRIFNIDSFNFLNDIDNGLHIFNTFGSLENTFLNNDVHPCYSVGSRNTKYGKAGLDFLNEKNLKYKKNYHGNGYPDYHLEHFLEGKWIIKKDNGKENLFLQIWDELADFSEKIDLELGFIDTVGAGEGAHMSIAAYNSSIKINLRCNPLCNIINTNFVSNYERKVSGEINWTMIG
jgi:hypothetical protein